MSTIIKDKVVHLDADILQAAKDSNFKTVQSKTTTQKSLNEILEKREQAEELHKEEKNQHLIEDAVYEAAKKVGDNATMEAIKNRELTEQQYQALSTKYGVNSDVEDNSEEKSKFELEAKEIVTKSLEFDKDTFRINSDRWEEVTAESVKKNPTLKQFLDKGIRVKANATGDVVEHMENTVKGDLKCKKGEQLFIFDYRYPLEMERFLGYIAKAKGCSIEEVENKYFLTLKEFEEKMKDKPSGSEEYKNFFNEEVNGHLAGYFVPAFAEEFRNVGVESDISLLGGYCARFNQDKYGWDNNNGGHGVSVRLLKN